MKRNTTLTLIMMLSSVAAAVAAPDAPTHATGADCIESRQIAAVVTREAVPETRSVVAPVALRQGASGRVITPCADDVTAPYRRLHSGSLKLPPAVCRDVT